MLKNLLFIFFVAFCLPVQSQNNEPIKSPSSFFPAKKTNVLVVGTFHFDYPGLDVHKTNETDKIDVLKEPKKSEVTELVNYIKKFKPTKIAIEATPEWNATEKLRQYKNGKFQNERDERFQLALRIASEIKSDTVYSIDIQSFDNELANLDTSYFNKLFKDFDFESSDPMTKRYKEWYGYEDKLPSKTNLLNYFKRINSKEFHCYDYGGYLIGDFKLDATRGADILSIWWYNRNLRIFRKLQEITQSPDDRILLIFGNGHAAVLRQLLESSPEYKFVEFDKLK